MTPPARRGTLSISRPRAARHSATQCSAIEPHLDPYNRTVTYHRLRLQIRLIVGCHQFVLFREAANLLKLDLFAWAGIGARFPVAPISTITDAYNLLWPTRPLSLSLTVSGPITAPSYEVQTGTAGFGSEPHSQHRSPHRLHLIRSGQLSRTSAGCVNFHLT